MINRVDYCACLAIHMPQAILITFRPKGETMRSCISRQLLLTATMPGLLALFSIPCGLVGEASGQERTAQKEVAVQILLKASMDSDPKTQSVARRALRSDDIGHELIAPQLEKMMSSDDAVTRDAAIWIFDVQQDYWPVEISTEIITRLLNHENKDVVQAALRLIEEEHATNLADQIIERLKDEGDVAMRFDSILALARHASTLEMALPYLENDFEKWDATLQDKLMDRLSALGRKAAPAIDFVASQADSTNPTVRQHCTQIASNLLDLPTGRSASRSSRSRNSSAARQATTATPEERRVLYIDGLFNRYDHDSNRTIDQAELEGMATSLKQRLRATNATKTSWSRADVEEAIFGK